MDLPSTIAELEIVDRINSERIRKRQRPESFFHNHTFIGATGKQRCDNKMTEKSATHTGGTEDRFYAVFYRAASIFVSDFAITSTFRNWKMLVFDKRSQMSGHEQRKKLNLRRPMLWTIFVILLVLWLLGLVSSYTLGGFIHILLVIAVVILIINLIQGRRTL